MQKNVIILFFFLFLKDVNNTQQDSNLVFGSTYIMYVKYWFGLWFKNKNLCDVVFFSSQPWSRYRIFHWKIKLSFTWDLAWIHHNTKRQWRCKFLSENYVIQKFSFWFIDINAHAQNHSFIFLCYCHLQAIPIKENFYSCLNNWLKKTKWFDNKLKNVGSRCLHKQTRITCKILLSS